MSPSTTMADPRQGADQPALPQPGDNQLEGTHPMTIAAANVTFPSPTFDPYAHISAESIYSAPPPLSRPKSLLQTLPTVSHSNDAENDSYSLKRGSNTTPKAVSSNEVRVSLSSHAGSGGEPRSRPVTEAQECIVSVPISDAGNAGCYSSEDMDRSVLEDLQVKAPPSNDRSIGSIKLVVFFLFAFLSLSRVEKGATIGSDQRHP
jgi:hypothetical protein